MSSNSTSHASPFHAGEIALQASVDVAERMAEFGRKVVRDFMPDQHRSFYAQLPIVVLGAVDTAGDVWATLLAGHPGFMASDDPRHLRISGLRDPRDPTLQALRSDAAIGMLGIELHTRRRNRMNGKIVAFEPAQFTVAVEHAFGNCPQYIQQRDFTFARAPDDLASLADAEAGSALTPRIRAMIEAADTFFVASYADDDAGRHVDVSHRGGKPGFVRIDSDGGFTIPDFAGNLHFNTLGNFVLNPRAGLVFPDFASGDLLQLVGTAEVITESAEIAAFQGAERIWRFRPTRWVLRPGALALRGAMRADGWSPNSLMTGDWQQAAARLSADRHRNQWRALRVTKIVDESSVIRSFHLEPTDGDGLLVPLAGQHLPIRITLDGEDEPVLRTYTLSSAPSDGQYRISVKREGRVSSWLHDQLAVGDSIEARAPAGQFTTDPLASHPAVLMAGGVGITPMLAMLRDIVFEGLRKRRIRRTFLFQAARSLAERAFDTEIAGLVAKAGGAVTWIRLLNSTDDAEPGKDYDAEGFIDAALLRRSLPFDRHDFYLCGPGPFMQAMHDQLRAHDVPEARIFAETFGPSALVRDPVATPGAAPPAPVAAATAPIPVAFAASGKEARWAPGSGSLLELAERRGLEPAFSCRSGSCGSCATRVLAGSVSYASPPTAAIAAGMALICCSVPAAGIDRLILDA